MTRISSIGLFALGWCVLAVRVPVRACELYCIMSLAFFYRMQPLLFLCDNCLSPPSHFPIAHFPFIT